MMEMLRRGDIIFVPFPFTDQTKSKLRPAIIIGDSSIETTGDVIIAMITTKYRKERNAMVIKNPVLSRPLPLKSYVRCDRVVTIDISLVQRKWGEANQGFTDSVSDKVCSLLHEN